MTFAYGVHAPKKQKMGAFAICLPVQSAIANTREFPR
jgi:hypothetical protein